MILKHLRSSVKDCEDEDFDLIFTTPVLDPIAKNLSTWKLLRMKAAFFVVINQLFSKPEEPDPIANKADDSAFHLAKDVNKKGQNDVEAT